ncbi:hypothetical protein THZG08_20006 [Vibrio owensii]|uniref:Uncharacterized protein n=1 Tax=Vibrio owensii TaxID=696485 RepID=A0AAU9Q5W9_9VIBR|nr:hypothetical protein THZG08_20006 [Vibrio owensii]CAH1525951.1 hypothetical protein THF1D04_20171 [Vibrio owensii]CAH1552720.1 hypothetical protein THZB04_10285 [Vibrio owensii]CAH1557024.1 hypothetical protein THOA03_20006 [Vibrio owensii]CAH1607447.1 hypothetical protein THF5G08_40207 [Vibrio jasicida]
MKTSPEEGDEGNFFTLVSSSKEVEKLEKMTSYNPK